MCVYTHTHTQWIPTLIFFSRSEYWSGQPFPSPGDLPNPGIEPRSPTLQVDSLPAKPQGKCVKEYVKAVSCHPADLIFMQNTYMQSA